MSEHIPYDLVNQHYRGQEGRLIPLLQRAQERDGYLVRERLIEIQKETGVPLATIYGVATFYAQFRLSPVGKNLIRVCHGTACHVAGARDITDAIEKHLEIANGETTADRLFTLETVSCLGCCSLAPVVMINNSTYGNLTDKQMTRVLKQYQKSSADTEAK